MTDSQAYVAFNLTDRIGSVTVAELVAKSGSAAAAWETFPKKVARAGGEVDWAREYDLAEKYGVRIITPADDAYPASLKSVPGHPLALYVKGNPAALSDPMVALVGTRRATAYGLDNAYALGRDLAARGWTIVSGLALGIDAEAHRGALAAGGTTVGVIGSGLDRFYPEENRALAREIVEKGGAVVSEFAFGRPPDQQTFPQRNHTVAALARGVVAVEAPLKSGTLITTGIAADLGRTVMAVPGRVDSRSSAGCLALIRDGARLVRDASDVESELSELLPRSHVRSAAPVAEAPREPVPKCSVEEAAVMKFVTAEGVTVDSLIRRTRLPAVKVNAICMELRLKERVRYLPGNRVALPRRK